MVVSVAERDTSCIEEPVHLISGAGFGRSASRRCYSECLPWCIENRKASRLETDSRLCFCVASEHIQTISEPRECCRKAACCAQVQQAHDEFVRPIDCAVILVAVAGVGAGQAAQRHHSVHECKLRLRFAGRNKLIHLLEQAEVSAAVSRHCGLFVSHDPPLLGLHSRSGPNQNGKAILTT